MSNDSIAASTQPVTQTTTVPNSPSFTYESHAGNDISDDILNRCAKLFSENYGIWGKNPTATRAPKPGSRVKMSGSRLREQCVAVPDSTVLVECYQPKLSAGIPNELELIGHGFATVWDYDSGRVGWVTQLVVSLSTRRKHIATSLIRKLKESPVFHGVTAVGLASSHPSACHALSKYTDIAFHSADLTFCQQNAKAILARSPVAYIKDTELRGSLFEDECTTGAVSSLFTDFYVDHKEPNEALAEYKNGRGWVLGEPVAGHEFLIILPAT